MHVHVSVVALTLITAGAWSALRSAPLPPQPSSPRWLRAESARFEIHYPPGLVRDLDRVSRSAERAYDRVSARLDFVLGAKVPLIMFDPSAEVTRQAAVAYATSDDVAPQWPHRSRIVLAVSDSDADLDANVVHEVTHLLVCEIILPSQSGTGGVPRWVHEGLAQYMVGHWSEADVGVMRTLAASDRIPSLSRLTDGSPLEPRVHDVLGHAAFDYIESRWGRHGIRRFVDGLIVPRVDAAYTSVLDATPQEFDAAFRQYAIRRFGADRRPRPIPQVRRSLKSRGVVGAETLSWRWRIPGTA